MRVPSTKEASPAEVAAVRAAMEDLAWLEYRRFSISSLAGMTRLPLDITYDGAKHVCAEQPPQYRLLFEVLCEVCLDQDVASPNAVLEAHSEAAAIAATVGHCVDHEGEKHHAIRDQIGVVVQPTADKLALVRSLKKKGTLPREWRRSRSVAQTA